MTLSISERELRSYVEITDQDRRVYRYLRDQGASPRDKVMHWCGFPSPRDQPVLAYVRFANSVIRLNQMLRRHGKMIEGGLDTGEIYRLVGGSQA